MVRVALRYACNLAIMYLIVSSLFPIRAQEDTAFREFLPAASRLEPVRSGQQVVYYKGYDGAGRFVGTVFKASGRGYASTIETMAGMTPDNKITVIKVVSLNETPGLGSRVAEGSFISQFSGRDVSALGQVQAVTGATISSRAVIDSVTAKAREIQELLKNER